MKFEEFGLHPQLLAAIHKLGYQECTPIQASVIPHVVKGQDISGLSQTGTGKTAAFLIPIMHRILNSRQAGDVEQPPEGFEGFAEWKPRNFVLILVPTRELAEQVMDNIRKLSPDENPMTGFAIYGGTGYDKQKEALRNGVDFIVATPGRLIDLYKEHLLDLKQVRAIIFDEADRLFDMGFKDDMKFILSRVPNKRQMLVFSATMNFDVLNMAYQFGAEPIEINLSPDQAKAENVKDELFHIGSDEKGKYLLSLVKKYNPKQAIVFTNYKNQVERIAHFLTDNSYPALGISSLISQSQRLKVMEQFKAENTTNILVATDVAARGLDIKGVDLVVNFDLPMDAETYVHRIGRTGRAGAEGVAFSLVSDSDVESLRRIEDYIKGKVPVGWMEDNDLVNEYKNMSENSYRRGGDRGGDRPRGPGGKGGGAGRGGPRRDRPERPVDERSEYRPGAGGEKSADILAGKIPAGMEPKPRQERAPRPERGPRPEGQHAKGPRSGGNQQRGNQQGRGGKGQQRGDRPHAQAKGRGPHKGGPQKFTPRPIQQKSIGQKIKSFFKTLFD